jgi:hypothetical protein
MKPVTVIGVSALVLVVAGVVFFAAARPAVSADPTGAKIAALQHQVKALQTQVKALRAADTIIRDQVSLNFEGDTCLGAQVADLIQGTWGVIDQIAQPLQQKVYFGPQVQVNDYKNCADLNKPNVPRGGIVVPPTIAPLLPLLQWLHEPL